MFRDMVFKILLSCLILSSLILGASEETVSKNDELGSVVIDGVTVKEKPLEEFKLWIDNPIEEGVFTVFPWSLHKKSLLIPYYF